MNSLTIAKSDSVTKAPVTEYELIMKITREQAKEERSLGWWQSKKETGRNAYGDVDAELKGAERKVESLRKTLESLLASRKHS